MDRDWSKNTVLLQKAPHTRRRSRKLPPTIYPCLQHIPVPPPRFYQVPGTRYSLLGSHRSGRTAHTTNCRRYRATTSVIDWFSLLTSRPSRLHCELRTNTDRPRLHQVLRKPGDTPWGHQRTTRSTPSAFLGGLFWRSRCSRRYTLRTSAEARKTSATFGRLVASG